MSAVEMEQLTPQQLDDMWHARTRRLVLALRARMNTCPGCGEQCPPPETVMRESQGDMNRPFFMNLLAQEWFSGIPEIHDRLAVGGRVADIGSGFGWSSIGLASEYKNITVDGFDLDEPSVESARWQGGIRSAGSEGSPGESNQPHSPDKMP